MLSLNCPKFTKICPFYSNCIHVLAPPKKPSQVVKKKLNLEKQVILLLEAFLVHSKSNKIFPIMLFFQNNNPEQYFTKYFQRKLLIKISKELKTS